jgi:uroporphyrinogen decarboxylase
MTHKQRMLAAMRNEQPDRVPVAPDMSNMIPCRLTGKPFWDIYLYQDPPKWRAYIDAVHHFGFDGWLPSAPAQFPHEQAEVAQEPDWQQAIVARTPERIYTREHAIVDGEMAWSDTCTAYYIDNPPTRDVALSKVGLSAAPPDAWEDVVPRNEYSGTEGYQAAKAAMGDHGVVGMSVNLPGLDLRKPELTYAYYDDRDRVLAHCQAEHERIVRRTQAILALRPDFLLIGMSGHMLANPEPIFRKLSLPTLQAVTRLCKAAGIPSQIHCCGPEYDLVRMAALESDLDSINPLEIPPMGDCHLAQVKREYGDRLSFMGNLHTTQVMLMGTPETVRQASRQAIDDAAAGGGFILSTGDQCGRDTPDENIQAMIEVAETYGRY